MDILLITILTAIATIIGTITGFGISTVMIPILLLSYPLGQTLLLVGIIHLFGNLWKVILFGHDFQWKLVLLFGIPGIIASYIGASFIINTSQQILSRILGAFLIAYVLWLFLNKSFQIKQTMVTQISGGALSGFLAGIFGIGGAVRAAFLSAFNLPKAVYISTAGAIALFVDTTRLTKYLTEGIRLEQRILWTLPLFIIVSFLSAYIAKRILKFIPQNHFRAVVVVLLFIIALKLLIFPGN